MRSAILIAGSLVATAIRPDLPVPLPATVAIVVAFVVAGLIDGIETYTLLRKGKQ